MLNKTKREIQTLSCLLTRDELRERGESLAETLGKIELVEAEKKAAADGFKAKLEELNRIAHALGQRVRSKREDREVEVVIEHDFIHRVVRTVRQDTGEVCHERTMSPTEAQMDMPRIGSATPSGA